VAIVVLALWIAAAAAGLTLLRAGGAARRRAAAPGAAESVMVRIGALPMTADGKPPAGPHTKVTTPPGEHPFLEFCHPALATAGIACWLMFVLVHYRPFAWIAVAIFVATMAVGLTWLAARRRALDTTWKFPPRLVALHGLIVTLAIAVTVLTAISAAA
jgi:hypothetical protein